jgi:hypothetical protein
VETLLTCCPPGPLDRQKTSSTSCGRHGFMPRPSRGIGLRTSLGLASLTFCRTPKRQRHDKFVNRKIFRP